MTAGNSLFFPAAVWIDDIQLTDQGRGPITRSRDERSVVVELANGTRKRYVKAVKHILSMEFLYLPDDSLQTIDGYAARDTMVTLLGDKVGSHTLRLFYQNGKYEDFTVFVTTYKEELIRRDPVSGSFFWNVSVEFEES